MILDENLEFADAASVGTPNNSTVNVGSAIDLGIAGRDVGNGQPLYLVIQVTTTIGSAGAAIVEFVLASDDVATLAVDGTQTIHYRSDYFAVAALVAGFELVVPLPSGDPEYERFLGFQVRETGAQALNAGAVNAFLTYDAHGWKGYADALPSFNSDAS